MCYVRTVRSRQRRFNIEFDNIEQKVVASLGELDERPGEWSDKKATRWTEDGWQFQQYVHPSAVPKATRVWLFRANKNDFVLVDEVTPDKTDYWPVKQYRDKLRTHDIVLLWQSGEEAGIYGHGCRELKEGERTRTMSIVTIEEAQASLTKLIHELPAGDEVVITENNQPVARLVGASPVRKPRQPGNCRGMLTIAREDDEHLKDFAEYMP